MGIHGLNKFLKEKCPNCYKKVNLHNFEYKKIAIDTSLYMYKYKCIFGEDRWMDAFINLVCCLRKNEIHCIFIFDSKAPIEKQQEQQERREQRNKIKQKLENIKKDWAEYTKTKKPSQLLLDICQESSKKMTRLLSSSSTIFKEDVVLHKIEKLELQTISISKKDFDLCKKIFKLMGIPYFQATTEAEATGAYLCRQGIVEGVLTQDTDVLAYGTPIFLTDINTHSEECTQINLEEVCNTLELSFDEFQEMCIMFGTDYNTNIPKIGPAKSYQLIKEYKCVENINENTILDITNLKYSKTKELFTFPPNYFTQNVAFCKSPNFNQLEEFLFKHNSRIHIDYVKKCFTNQQIIFKD